MTAVNSHNYIKGLERPERRKAVRIKHTCSVFIKYKTFTIGAIFRDISLRSVSVVADAYIAKGDMVKIQLSTAEGAIFLVPCEMLRMESDRTLHRHVLKLKILQVSEAWKKYVIEAFRSAYQTCRSKGQETTK